MDQNELLRSPISDKIASFKANVVKMNILHTEITREILRLEDRSTANDKYIRRVDRQIKEIKRKIHSLNRKTVRGRRTTSMATRRATLKTQRDFHARRKQLHDQRHKLGMLDQKLHARIDTIDEEVYEDYGFGILVKERIPFNLPTVTTVTPITPNADRFVDVVVGKDGGPANSTEERTSEEQSIVGCSQTSAASDEMYTSDSSDDTLAEVDRFSGWSRRQHYHW